MTARTITGAVTLLGRHTEVSCEVELRPAQARLLLGWDSSPGDFAAALAALGSPGYHRDFGVDGPDEDPHTEPPAHGSTKQRTAPADCVLHVGWKDDVGLIGPWLAAAPPERRYWLTWWHEPMGDMTPAAYRASAGELAELLADHPRRHQVLGHGPVVTRYWLDQAGGDPADWWYPGATMYGTDCYTGGARYRPPAEMFGSAARAARERGVPWLVPEWGSERVSGDTTGAGRAAWIRDCVAWLREQRDCLAVAWWHVGGCRLDRDPERAVFRELLAGG